MIPTPDAGASIVGTLIIVAAAVAVLVSLWTSIQVLRRRAERRTAFATGLIVFAPFAILQLIALRRQAEAIAVAFLMVPMLTGIGTMVLSVGSRSSRESTDGKFRLLSAVTVVIASALLIFSTIAVRKARVRELVEEASRAGNAPAIRSLIASGAMKSVDDSLLQSLLVRAALEHEPDLVRVLLAAGADADAEGRDYTGQETTPLIAAVREYAIHDPDEQKAARAKIATIEILLEAGADPLRPGTRDRLTALAVARTSRFVEVVELLERKKR